MLGGFVAAATLGGIAVAAGTGAMPAPFGGHHDGPGAVHASDSAFPGVPGPGDGAGPTGDSGRPPSASAVIPTPTAPGAGHSSGDPDDDGRSGTALCRAYEKAEGHGKAMDSSAAERLEAAAGGPSEVKAYCAGILNGASGGGTGNGQGANGKTPGTAPGEVNKPQKPQKPQKPERPEKPGKSNKPGEPGEKSAKPAKSGANGSDNAHVTGTGTGNGNGKENGRGSAG